MLELLSITRRERPSSMNKSFEESIRSFQSRLVETIDEREPVSDRDAVKAACVLKYICYRTKADIFLGCAALNLLNAYVKNRDAKLGNGFKILLGPMLNAISELNSPNIKVAYDNSQQMGILMICFRNFQFSFKSRPLSQLTMQLSNGREIPWDGIRKQNKAVSILDFALDLPFISNVTSGGENLHELLEREMSDFESGCFRFTNGKLVKVANVTPAKDMEDKWQKNHFRAKFDESVGSLVILRARFRGLHRLHVTFGNVRPYIKGVNTLTVCNHITVFRPTLEKYINPHDLVDKGSYYIIGYCEPYFKDPERIGIILAEDLDHAPILRSTDFHLITNNTFERSFQFGLESHMAARQRHVVYV